jgi:hypothetical protein
MSVLQEKAQESGRCASPRGGSGGGRYTGAVYVYEHNEEEESWTLTAQLHNPSLPAFEGKYVYSSSEYAELGTSLDFLGDDVLVSGAVWSTVGAYDGDEDLYTYQVRLNRGLVYHPLVLNPD